MNEGRRVHSVRLRAATPALVQRGALLLEDALRTASMPDPGRGRVLFIRSLALGTIRPDRSPSSLALALEQKVRALASDAVHAEDEGAPAANAVYFADAVQALVALGARLGRPGALGAWFWPLVLPEAWGKPGDEAMRAVLAAALEVEPGPAAAVALVEGMIARGVVGALMGALRWVDGPRLARAFWGYAPEVDRGVVLARAPSEELEALAAPVRELLEAWVGTWGPEDVRSVWLGAVAISLKRPAMVVEASVPARAMRVVAAAAVAVEARGRSTEAARETVRPVRRADEASRESPAPVRAQEPESSAPVTRGPEVPPAVASMVRERPVREEETIEAEAAPHPEPAEISAQEWPETPEPTSAGGLLFLVHALNYLGLEELLATQPELRERAIAEHFLAWVAMRFGVPAHDPVLRALRVRELPPLAGPCAFNVPARMRARIAAPGPARAVRLADDREIELDARGRMVLAVRRAHTEGAGMDDSSTRNGHPDGSRAGMDDSSARSAHPDGSRAGMDDSSARSAHPDGSRAGMDDSSARSAHPDGSPGLARAPDLELLLRTLYLSAARLLRTRARITLRALVLRPARVASTLTHLDLLFDHSLSDLRIRRAGLDIDPGWVPWLGRVIRYHYLHGELPQT